MMTVIKVGTVKNAPAVTHRHPGKKTNLITIKRPVFHYWENTKKLTADNAIEAISIEIKSPPPVTTAIRAMTSIMASKVKNAITAITKKAGTAIFYSITIC